MSDSAEKDRLVAVVHPSGRAMFHAPSCAHAKRAMSGMYAVASDFMPGDVWCSACRPQHDTPAAQTGPDQ